MWTLFFELHTGPWQTSGHNKRPDTRPIQVPNRRNSQKIFLQNWGHPHTPRPDPSRRPGSSASPNRSPECTRQPCASPSMAHHGAGQASYDAGRRGHPPHQFTRVARNEAATTLPWAIEVDHSWPSSVSSRTQKQLVRAGAVEPPRNFFLPILSPLCMTVTIYIYYFFYNLY